MKNEKLQTGRKGQKHLAVKKGAVAKSDVSAAPCDEVATILGRAPNAAFPARRIPARWRWHYRALLALQSRLRQEREELVRASTQPIEPHSMDEADSATDEFDHDLTLAQLSVEQNALYEVTRALRRIAEGTYGICEETGRAIPGARLKAVPWTRFTREVEERLEKEGAVSGAHLNNPASARGPGKIWFTPETEAAEAEEGPLSPPHDEKLRRPGTPSWPKIYQHSVQRSGNRPIAGPHP
jgi:RNA polymerase-binding transcription factor DksA